MEGYGFVFNKYKFNLTDEELVKSPYLKVLTETDLGSEKDEEDNIILTLDVSPSVLQNYVNYLKGRVFFLSTTEDNDFFDFMGTDNYYEFTPEYWRHTLQGDIHGKCSNTIDKVDTIIPISNIEFVDRVTSRIFRSDITLYYVGDTALLTAGIISKPSTLPIIYNIKDRDIIMKHMNREKSNTPDHVTIFPVLGTVKHKDSNVIKTPYKTFKPLLRKDNEVQRAKFPGVIWNDDTFMVQFIGLDFNCMEELLYIFPVDTDGIVMEVKDHTVIKTLATTIAYRSYMTRTVNCNPDLLDTKLYMHRLCDLSLMGFKVNIPRFNDIVSIDSYKEDVFNLRVHNNSKLPLSISATYGNSKIHEKTYSLTTSDYLALLTIGPTRYSERAIFRPIPLVINRPDLNELYKLSQFVDDNDLIHYQYDKNDLESKTMDGMLYNFKYDNLYCKIYRLDFFDITIDKKYVIGPILCELILTGKSTLKLETSDDIPKGEDVFDQIYASSDGVVYASFPLIYTLVNREYYGDKYTNIKNKLM